MKNETASIVLVLILFIAFVGCQSGARESASLGRIQIVASDTLLSGMSESLLPSDKFEVTVILPPGQCPGHYDLKLSDIARVKNADLVVSFRGLPFMQGADIDEDRHFSVDPQGRNWMVPATYLTGIDMLAAKFSELFPDSASLINERREQTAQEITEKKTSLDAQIENAAIGQKSVIASSMIRESLEWMGFRVAGEYNRPESISAKEIADIIRTGKAEGAVLVADNLQSGPDTGRGISEALGISHVTLANFPMENGYAATLNDNVNAVLAAMQ